MSLQNGPRRRVLAVIAVLVAGFAVGLGLFTFVYAKGYPYLG